MEPHEIIISVSLFFIMLVLILVFVIIFANKGIDDDTPPYNHADDPWGIYNHEEKK